MAPKKPERNKAAYARSSLVSRSLGGILRDTTRPPLPEEPWRNQKPMGKNRGKRKK
jgi:hypothetical protein